jgi:hypothetical protein
MQAPASTWASAFMTRMLHPCTTRGSSDPQLRTRSECKRARIGSQVIAPQAPACSDQQRASVATISRAAAVQAHAQALLQHDCEATVDSIMHAHPAVRQKAPLACKLAQLSPAAFHAALQSTGGECNLCSLPGDAVLAIAQHLPSCNAAQITRHRLRPDSSHLHEWEPEHSLALAAILPHMPQLQSLTLAGNGRRLEQAFIERAAALPSLTHLSIGSRPAMGTCFGGTAWIDAHIAPGLGQLSRLRCLDISSAGLSDDS